ncbi:RING finger protein nhl-1 isoform X5 [Drosophila kikkawai]|uniref:RING finger protein nhl-1 isoform X5 n=1 Tax=Drosophila kikkawai TaxID=30033 RepID=A0ABM3C7H0_DROKI|nr:RING finger protein nhl-1 isoform X5 [Drosophila kikkawai]
MEQFEQLLTCCVCLDRYRIPKLLPCQHSFCMEPCMEGLVDYVRRQVKCPECRAEHRIPYNGVQAFPTNVTLQRFLELHIEITGELPDPTSGQIMERCGVCSEKAYLSHCAHCEKKICEDCKSAHMDILRREITRFNSQIRRSLHRLQDSLAIIEKNTMSLQTNAISVTEEIDEIYRRITKAIKDRSDQLKGEIDRYLAVELRNLTTLKENLDLEITNITSNCDIVDKYMNETVEWDDCELMDTKEIFLKTVEFLRHFEYENNDYSRRVRFLVSIDPNQLVMNLATFGDLNIAPHSTPSGGSSVSSSHLAPPSALQPGLMRSKSDHRLATQFRQQEERGGYNDEPVLGGRKFGERPQRSATQANNDRYGRSGGDYDYENDYENEGSSGRAGKSSRFRSRFVRSHQNDDSDNEQLQQQQRQQELKERKDRVLDSEDVSRGQLSGIIRLSDCSRVVQRLADIGKEKKEKKSDAAAAAQAAVQAAIQAQKAAMQRQQQKNQQAAADEEAELAKKRKNAAAAASAAATGAATSSSSSGATDTASDQRVASLKSRGGEDSDGSSTQAASPVRNSAAAATRAESQKPPVSAQVAAVKKTQRSGSSDSSASTESSASSAAATAAAASAAAATTAAASGSKTASSSRNSTARDATAVPEKKPFVSRFLPQHNNTSSSNGSADKKKAESSSSSEEETSSESESESEPETKPKASAASSSTNTKSTPSSAASSTTTAASTGSSYRDRLEARRASRDDSSSTAAGRSSYATPSSSGYGSGTTSSARSRAVPAPHHASESEDRYGSGTGSSALPFSIPYISRPSRARYRKRLADV